MGVGKILALAGSNTNNRWGGCARILDPELPLPQVSKKSLADGETLPLAFLAEHQSLGGGAGFDDRVVAHVDVGVPRTTPHLAGHQSLGGGGLYYSLQPSVKLVRVA